MLASLWLAAILRQVNGGVYPNPIRFGRGEHFNLEGFSDHYPITMRLEEGD